MGGKLGLSVILHEDSCEFVVVEVLVLHSALEIEKKYNINFLLECENIKCMYKLHDFF